MESPLIYRDVGGERKREAEKIYIYDLSGRHLFSDGIIIIFIIIIFVSICRDLSWRRRRRRKKRRRRRG